MIACALICTIEISRPNPTNAVRLILSSVPITFAFNSSSSSRWERIKSFTRKGQWALLLSIFPWLFCTLFLIIRRLKHKCGALVDSQYAKQWMLGCSIYVFRHRAISIRTLSSRLKNLIFRRAVFTSLVCLLDECFSKVKGNLKVRMLRWTAAPQCS